MYKGRQTGAFGNLGYFSFYPTMNITTLEGGIINNDDPERAGKLRQYRNHCMTRGEPSRSQAGEWHYDITALGYNSRMNIVSAALGICQLKRLDATNKKRISPAGYYNAGLPDVKSVETPFVDEDVYRIYHPYLVKVIKALSGINRDKLRMELAKRGILTSVHYIPPASYELLQEKV